MLPDVSDKTALDESTVEELMQRERNGEPLFKRLFNIYLDETPTLLSEVESAMAAKDVERCYDAIHQMKGSAAAMGARRLFAITEAALELCRDDRVFEVEGLLKRLKEESDLYIRKAQARLRV